MAPDNTHEPALSPDRRSLLKWTSAIAGAAGAAGIGLAQAQERPAQAPVAQAPVAQAPVAQAPAAVSDPHEVGGLRKGMFSYMLAHEEFPVPELVRIGSLASRSGFQVLSTSDHLQPWQANEGHAGQAWVTMGALGAQSHSWMGTTVTCPTMRTIRLLSLRRLPR